MAITHTHAKYVSDTLRENVYKEEKLRAMHPGLKDLWEQYQTMLKLVDDGSIVDEQEELIIAQQRMMQVG